MKHIYTLTLIIVFTGVMSVHAQCFNMTTLDDPNTTCEVWKYQKASQYSWGFRVESTTRWDYGVGTGSTNPLASKGVKDYEYTTHTIITKDTADFKVPSLRTLPPGESSCIRLGRPFAVGKLNSGGTVYGPRAEHIEMVIDVTKDNSIFIFQYAAVMQAPENHTTSSSDNQVPQMYIEIYDAATGNQLAPNRLSFYLLGRPSLQTARNWTPCTLDGERGYWKDWTTYGFDCTPYIGKTLIFYIENDDCAILADPPVYNNSWLCAKHYGYMYFHLNCAPSKIDYECNGNKAKLTAPTGFNYKWYKQGSSTLLGEEQTLEINANDPITTYQCDLYFKGRESSEHTSVYITTEPCRVEQTDTINLCTNELPYTWRPWRSGGFVISSMADNGKVDTVWNGSDIDSIVTLKLTINQAYYPNKSSYDSVENKVLCACEAKTYSWEGHTFAQYEHITDTTHIYLKDTLTTLFGCDSVMALNLTIIPIDTIINPLLEYCKNDLPQPWYHHTITGEESRGDTIHQKIHPSNKCYSIIRLDSLNIYQPDSLFDHQNVCSFPYEWTPPSWTSSITIHNMEEVATKGKIELSNMHHCDSIIQLVVHMLPTTTMPDTNAVVCQAEHEYFIWPGHEHLGQLTESKTYRDTARYKESGCDSAYFTLNLRFVVPQTETTELAHICEGDAYNWEKHPKYQGLTEGGIYKDTLLSKEGCDSLYSTLQLTVHIAKDSLERDTACSNDVGYEWHGKWIEFGEEEDYLLYDTLRSGTCDSIRFTMQLHKVSVEQEYAMATGCAPAFTWTDKWGEEHTFTYPTKNITIFHQEKAGCQSTVDVTISYLQPSASSHDTTLCSSEFPFDWHGYTIQSAADNGKKDTLHNVAGCDSVVTLNMTIHPAYVEKLGTDIQLGTKYINTGETFSFCGRDLTETGFYKDTISCLVSSCDSVVSVNLKVLNNIGHEYDTICQGDVKIWNGSEYTKTGDYEYHTTTTHGTDSTAILHLWVNPSYTGIMDGDTICENELSDYEWEGEHFTKDNLVKTKTLTTATGCDSTVTFTLSVKFLTIAATETVVAIEGDTYTWEGHGEKFKNLTQAGTYKDTARYQSGCDSVYYTLQLSFVPAKIEGTLLLPTTICGDDKVLNVEFICSEGVPTTYDILFSGSNVSNYFKDTLQCTYPQGTNLNHAVPVVWPNDESYVRPNSYELSLILRDTKGQTYQYDAAFMVLYPSSILTQRWNDVLMLNNATFNGGYEFSRIQWYHGGEVVNAPTATGSYIYTNLAMGESYWAELTRVDDGNTIRTCDYIPTPQDDNTRFAANIQVAARRGGNMRQLQVTANISGQYKVYDATGKIVGSGNFSSTPNDIDLPAAGCYILQFVGDEGTKETRKWIAK